MHTTIRATGLGTGHFRPEKSVGCSSDTDPSQHAVYVLPDLIRVITG
jgi:hypothetical protein